MVQPDLNGCPLIFILYTFVNFQRQIKNFCNLFQHNPIPSYHISSNVPHLTSLDKRCEKNSLEGDDILPLESYGQAPVEQDK